MDVFTFRNLISLNLNFSLVRIVLIFEIYFSLLTRGCGRGTLVTRTW